MDWYVWVMGACLWVLIVLLIKWALDYVEKAHDGADEANLLLQYVTCLHECGVDSDEARDFKLGNANDEHFLRRAQAMDAVFRMKQRVDTMWEGK